jgi:hypothetical protein
MSLHQATQPSTKRLCDASIRYGFQLGQARPQTELSDADLFPGLSLGRLRKTIVDDDAGKLQSRLEPFSVGFELGRGKSAGMHSRMGDLAGSRSVRSARVPLGGPAAALLERDHEIFALAGSWRIRSSCCLASNGGSGKRKDVLNSEVRRRGARSKIEE